MRRRVQALALTHAEFVLIHPFREGSGRLVRLLSTLMAVQASLPALDYMERWPAAVLATGPTLMGQWVSGAQAATIRNSVAFTTGRTVLFSRCISTMP